MTGGPDEAMDLANRIAPEHLVVDRESLTRRPIVAGAVFVGAFTAQAAGDYATESWTATATVDEFLAEFDGWDGRLAGLRVFGSKP